MDRCDSGFEREVLQMLLEAGYRAKPQVSAGRFRIDIVVEGRNDRRLAIELDGDRYHGPAQWEQDMQRQAALERAGWVFWRVFGSQWSNDRQYWWDNLMDRLTHLEIEPIGAVAEEERLTEFRIYDPDRVTDKGEELDGTDALDKTGSGHPAPATPSTTQIAEAPSAIAEGARLRVLFDNDVERELLLGGQAPLNGAFRVKETTGLYIALIGSTVGGKIDFHDGKAIRTAQVIEMLPA